MNVREKDTFGDHENDFEHKCCFRDMIVNIGEGTKHGSGELVHVAMRSGKTAVYKLYSEKYNSFDDTGQRNWQYLFMGYLNEGTVL